MISCNDFRRTLLAEPRAARAELAEHGRTCPDCSAYAADLARFEDRLERAMRFPVGSAGNVVPLRPKKASRGARWFAMAASVLVAVVVAGALWIAAPRPSLADAAVAHMAGEPQAWTRTDLPVSAQRLAAVLEDAHVRLLPGVGVVSYANSCAFRGWQVPHLVVQSERGPVTVMVLAHETVHKSVRFDEQGYRGEIVPVPGHGSLAVLTQGVTDPAWVDRVAARLVASIRWTG
jgi:hypothetical protein